MSTQEHDLEKGNSRLSYNPGVQQVNLPLNSDYPQPPLNSSVPQPSSPMSPANLQPNNLFNASMSHLNPPFSRSLSPNNHQETVRPQLPREMTTSPSHMTVMSRQPSGMFLSQNQTLAMFRYHLGIHSDPSLIGPKHQPKGQRGSRSMSELVSNVTGNSSRADTALSPSFSRPAPNVGIYQRVIIAEKKYHKEYRTFSFLINGALGLQIIFAAALTALGAANGSHTAVTAFGALNTVIAGLLTFLKGSGLPNRLKYYENEWTKVREHIEQRERDFATDAHFGTLGWEEMTEEIEKIEHMYDNVRKDIEANTPDSYISMSNAMKSIQSNGSGPNTTKTTLARGLSRVNQKGDVINQNMNQMGHDVNARVTSGISDIHQRASKGFGDLEKQTSVHIREVSDDTQNRIRDAGKQAETQFVNASNSVNDGARRIQSSTEERLHAIDENMYATENAARSQFQNAQNRLSEGQHQAESKAKEIESKIMHAGEKAAEKFLDFAKHRHN